MPIRHKFVSTKADQADSTDVRPSDWNETHELNNFTSQELNKVLPDQAGHTGEYLQTDGTDATWQSIGLALQSFVISDNLDLVFTDSGGFVLYDV